MATHAGIWTPFEKDGITMALFSEAWSDGYIRDGVGEMLHNSTPKMDEICKLNVLFAGSPVLYDPVKNQFFLKEEDFILEGYEGAGIDQVLIDSAEETMKFLEAGDLTSAYQTHFAQMPLDDKLALDMGINARYLPEDEAWAEFTDGATVLTEQEFLACYPTEELDCSLTYYWRDNIWYTSWYSESTLKYVAPLSGAIKLDLFS